MLQNLKWFVCPLAAASVALFIWALCLTEAQLEALENLAVYLP